MNIPVVATVRDSGMRPKMVRRWLPPILFLAALIGLWQLWTAVGHIAPWVLPSPTAVARSGWAARTPLVGHTMTTLTEAIVGLVLGTVVGLVIALIIDSIPTIQRAVWPVIVTSQTIPVIVLAPLLAIWFGFGLQPKIVLVALITFFPVTVSAVAGLGGVDPEQTDLVRSFGGTRRQVLRVVKIPSAIPTVIAGVQIAAAYAIGDAVIGEYIGGSSGLGIFIDRSRSSYRTDQMLAGVVVIAVLSIVLFGLVGLVGRRLTPWKSAATVTNDRPGTP